MLITPPDLAGGLLVYRGSWAFVSWCLAASAPMPPSHVRLYRCRTPSLLCGGTDGPVGPPLRPILASAGLLACRSTGPTLQFLYSRQARSRTFASRRVSGAVRVLPAPGRARLAASRGVYASSLVSGASGG